MTDPYGNPPRYGQQPHYGAPPYGAPPAPYYAQPGNPYVGARTSPDAGIALGAAIVAWLFLPILADIVALVFASRASKAIAASGGAVTGAGMVTAARIIAGIHLALLVGLIVLFAGLVVAFH